MTRERLFLARERIFFGPQSKVFEKHWSRERSSEGQRQMEGSNDEESVRPVRARKNGRKMRRERTMNSGITEIMHSYMHSV